ncbi:acyl-CoA carboxylase epsilon subunit [Streptomyces rhizosphaerihabitans]|uniref:acyl-CoA carboxylase epsilon subunit n=1 Tax=Streptomyces rhizosphaerihabitans TaxID=1266770 RepID=UPI0021C1C1BB|nr:acyl-CoA carboxylase epsilon subunit [Streptomyces rhizosphaerihabitans]MCT9004758.1 acyl-CoA carboxylase subunit epsilon [Streptomyces rhizosphaerihabitans]
MPTVQIVKGEPADDELAALTAVLLARVAAAQRSAQPRSAQPRSAQPRSAHGDGHPQARWRRLECVTSYRNPVSWR